MLIAGGPSGNGLATPDGLVDSGRGAGYHRPRDVPAAAVARRPRRGLPGRRLVAVPSYSESFGLVAVEAQACGTPVVAAAVGGLPVAVRDGVSGALVDGHDTDDWAKAIGDLFARGPATMRGAAVEHAAQFSWAHTVDALLASYGHAMHDYRAVAISTAQRATAVAARRSGAPVLDAAGAVRA